LGSSDRNASAVPDASARNIEAIASLERAALHDRSLVDRCTDAVTSAAGTLAFLAAHAVWFTGWIVVNVTRDPPFDPYPFNLLMLITSIEAIVLTTIVLMTQNRMTRQADKRAHLDLQVNLLAEQELTAMLHMLHALCQRLGVSVTVRDAHVEQLLKETDIHQLASAVERELESTGPSSAVTSAPTPHTPSPHQS
jgi:uncharacterized membrane protein